MQLGDQPLGAPANGAGEMQISRRRKAARQDEGAQRLELAIEEVDLAFQPSDLRGGNGQPRATRSLALARRRQIGAGVEQVF